MPAAMWRKPEWRWKCGCAGRLERGLPSEGGSQRDDQPEAESGSSPTRSVAVGVLEKPEQERP